MRCDQCNKFVPYDDSTEPEADVTACFDCESPSVTVDARIVLTCAECGQELKEYNFSTDADVDDFDTAHAETCDMDAEVTSSELTTRSSCGVNKRTGKPNKYNPRYSTTYYGHSTEVRITCACGKIDQTQTVYDDIAASGMDELI